MKSRGERPTSRRSSRPQAAVQHEQDQDGLSSRKVSRLRFWSSIVPFFVSVIGFLICFYFFLAHGFNCTWTQDLYLKYSLFVFFCLLIIGFYCLRILIFRGTRLNSRDCSTRKIRLQFAKWILKTFAIATVMICYNWLASCLSCLASSTEPSRAGFSARYMINLEI
jgi:hypothetical protein